MTSEKAIKINKIKSPPKPKKITEPIAPQNKNVRLKSK